MTATPIKLGKYTLGEQLGSGGFGTVYKATDSIGRNVAIKLLKSGWSDDPTTIERFRREAQVAGELYHSRIATITDFDEVDGRLFLVMRYVNGISLDKLIRQKGRLEWAQTLQILEQTADGLDYAHQRGFIHRDIKPANILVGEKEGAVLTDFGLVKAADVSGMSTTGVMLGTPHYIAPEIWEGKSITSAVDLYSLACVAYEMLTGQVLFAGGSPPEIMTKHMQPAPLLPEKWPQGVPGSVREVFLRALQRDPQLRYPNAAAFVADLKKQEAILRREVETQAQVLLETAGALLAKGELAQAQEKFSEAAALAPRAPGIPDMAKKLEDAVHLEKLYAEAADHYQMAQEKAKAVLDKNPSHPDPKGLFQKVGLRGWQMPKFRQTPPETAQLRWQEKSIPIVLMLAAVIIPLFPLFEKWIAKPIDAEVIYRFYLLLVPQSVINSYGQGNVVPALLPLIPISLVGLAAGFGLFWRKNWARKAGLFFAVFMEAWGFWWIWYAILFIGGKKFQEILYPVIYYSVPISLGFVVILLAAFIFLTLSGQRMANLTGAAPVRPAGIWQIFVAYFATILGIVPAILLLTRTSTARIWAQRYAAFLMLALPIAGLIVGGTMKNNSVGQIITGIVVLFCLALCVLAFRYLGSPAICAYYENREN